MSNRPRLSARRRYSVLERDGFTCRYCGARAPEVRLEVDHVQAVALGGGNEYQNLVTACMECNRGKFAKPFVDYAELADEVVGLRRRLSEARSAAITKGIEMRELRNAYEYRGRIIEVLMERLGAPRPEDELGFFQHYRKKYAALWCLPDDLQRRLDERDVA